MSVNKLLPATLVLLALASSTATAACSVSEQSALDGTTHTFTGTTLEADTLVPMTTETMTFKSDGDGIGSDPTKSITTTTSGDTCQFTVACPSGFFVYLNVSGRFVSSPTSGVDRISATGGGKSYDYSFPESSTEYTGGPPLGYTEVDSRTGTNIITAASTLTWTQSAHYHAGSQSGQDGTGYQVVAGCTSFVAETCPYSGASTHFSSLTTATLGTKLDLRTDPPWLAPSVPSGFKCTWPVTCPSGGAVKLYWGYQGLASGDSGKGIQGITLPGVNMPVFLDASGNVLPINTAANPATNAIHSTNVNVASITWNTSTWNTTASVPSGFAIGVECEAYVPTPVPTNSQCTASPQAELYDTIYNLNGTTLHPNYLVPMTTTTKTFIIGNPSQYSGQQRTISSSSSGENCLFGVTCPTGYYVYLNVSGTFLTTSGGRDRIYATGGNKSYDFSFNVTSTTAYGLSGSNSPSVITAANTLTWSQSAHHDSSAQGFEVIAGCTSFVAGTCPYSNASTHFSSLATASAGTSVTLSNYVSGEDSTGYPVGLKCAWPVTCPVGTVVSFTWVHHIKGYGSNPHKPVIKDASGNVLSYTDDPSVFTTSHSAVSINWETTQWNVTNTVYSRGFSMEVECVNSTSTSSSSLSSISSAVGSPVTSNVFSTPTDTPAGASVVSFAAAVVAAIVVALV